MPQKNSEPLTKDAVLRLHGGKDGEKIFLEVDRFDESRVRCGHDIIEATVWRNRKSQKGTAYPEGYLWLNSRVNKSKKFRYDIARAKCALPRYHDWYGGERISSDWHDYPAQVFQPPCGSDHEILWRIEARKAEARQLLCQALGEHSADIVTIEELLAEALGLEMIAPGDDGPAKRVLRWIPSVSAELASDIREAILAKGLPTPASSSCRSDAHPSDQLHFMVKVEI